MPFRHLQPHLDPASDQPLSLQVARLLVREMQEGRLQPGEALPGSRALAEDLEVTRHAVMSALRELELEGWVESRPASGTFVADPLPATVPRHWGHLPSTPSLPEEPAFDLPESLAPVTSLALGVLDLSEGMPDARLAPKEALAKAYQRAIRRHGDDLLGRGEPRGNAALREQLAQHLHAHRGLPIGPENVLVTRGTAMTRALWASALIPKGGHVAVENPGQQEAWEAFRTMGHATLHPVPVDAEGLDTEALAHLAARQPLDAVLVTPRRHIPTTVPMSPERRRHLMDLAARHGFAILEEDPDAELFGHTSPRHALACSDPEGHVLHAGSLAATLAPGLGLGFLVAPKTLVDRLARARQRLDDQGDRVLEWALADLIRDGDYERHLARVRQVYQQRMEDGLEAIAVDLGKAFSTDPPEGGLACWLRAPGIDVATWVARAQQAGVRLRTTQTFEGQIQAGLRLGFGAFEPGEFRRALKLLRKTLELPRE